LLVHIDGIVNWHYSFNTAVWSLWTVLQPDHPDGSGRYGLQS